jgi:hypothetical protein
MNIHEVKVKIDHVCAHFPLWPVKSLKYAASIFKLSRIVRNGLETHELFVGSEIVAT